MQRNEWKIEYPAAQLAEASQAKIAHHGERLEFWKSKREETLAKIRSEGLEIDEKIVMGFQSPKARDWERANRVTVRDDLRQQLDEVLDKLRSHTEKIGQYDGWRQMLLAGPEKRMALDIDDCLFFFGKS